MNRSHLTLWMLPALFAFLTSLAGCRGDSSITFYLTFKDAKTLQAGQPLVYKGITIGEVTDVGLEPGGTVKVTAKAYGKYLASLYREAGFKIDEGAPSTGATLGRQITMYDRGTARTPIKGGEIIEGTETEFGSWFDKLSDTGKSLWNSIAGVVASGWESVHQYFGTPDGEKFLKNVEEYARKAKDLGKDQYESFKKKALPELEQQASQLREKMKKEGRYDDAKRFWDGFLKWQGKQQGKE